jgi:hypothetical protein
MNVPELLLKEYMVGHFDDALEDAITRQRVESNCIDLTIDQQMEYLTTAIKSFAISHCPTQLDLSYNYEAECDEPLAATADIYCSAQVSRKPLVDPLSVTAFDRSFMAGVDNYNQNQLDLSSIMDTKS